MSGFVCAFGPEPLDARTWLAVAERLRGLGTERWQFVRRAGGAIGLGRFAWEDAAEFSGGVLIAEDGPYLVAADAALYYRDDLRRRLAGAGVAPRSLAPADLILAAYRAWGDTLCEYLEGDYAFAIWDRRARRALAARDLTGRRGLYFAARDGRFAVGSSVGALRELPFVAAPLNLAAIGAQAAGMLWSGGSDTAFEDVHVVPAAHVVVWDGRSVSAPRAFWTPPTGRGPSPERADEAALVLRKLIQDAVAERLAAGVSTVWLSGGWDSSAVFAAGQSRLKDPARLQPVSISYPEGDPGREDELIDAIAGRWNAGVRWIRSADIPLLDNLPARAAASDEPPAHLYELWNVALARGTRAAGARIALYGSGGDQLFQVSDAVMADMLRAGRWWRLARHVRARRIGFRRGLHAAVLPLLPHAALRGAERLAGRPLQRHYMERPVPAWIRGEFVSRFGLRERELAVLGAPRTRAIADRETTLFLTAPLWGFGAAYVHGALLREGVEARSPLLDRRVVEFALQRPVEERSSPWETKVLLRRSMQGLLPERILAPRRYRTGVTVGFSRARMREAYPALFDLAFAEDLRLAALGIVDPERLRRAATDWLANGDDYERVSLFHTLKVEFWLRGLETRTAEGSGDSTLGAVQQVMGIAG